MSCFLTFNVFDWLGRSLTAITMWVSEGRSPGPCEVGESRQTPREGTEKVWWKGDRAFIYLFIFIYFY